MYLIGCAKNLATGEVVLTLGTVRTPVGLPIEDGQQWARVRDEALERHGQLGTASGAFTTIRTLRNRADAPYYRARVFYDGTPIPDATWEPETPAAAAWLEQPEWVVEDSLSAMQAVIEDAEHYAKRAAFEATRGLQGRGARSAEQAARDHAEAAGLAREARGLLAYAARRYDPLRASVEAEPESVPSSPSFAASTW